MTDWPIGAMKPGVREIAISPMHPLSLGSSWGMMIRAAPGSTAWPAANRAILVPFRVPVLVTAYQMVVGCGATAAGNFDVGIYTRFGERLVSSGAVAKPAASEAVVDITDTQLFPGVYYMALAADGTNNYTAIAPAAVGLCQAAGVRQASAAYTLPATVTFETMATSYVPNFSVWLSSL